MPSTETLWTENYINFRHSLMFVAMLVESLSHLVHCLMNSPLRRNIPCRRNSRINKDLLRLLSKSNSRTHQTLGFKCNFLQSNFYNFAPQPSRKKNQKENPPIDHKSDGLGAEKEREKRDLFPKVFFFSFNNAWLICLKGGNRKIKVE